MLLRTPFARVFHHCSTRTTTTVTLSADPRCTALLASLLQAASYLASTADLASLAGAVLSCRKGERHKTGLLFQFTFEMVKNRPIINLGFQEITCMVSKIIFSTQKQPPTYILQGQSDAEHSQTHTFV